jgi:hypothetical protein
MGQWLIAESTPDDQDPSRPTPDCVLTDGLATVAAEIKRLKGEANW